MASNDDWDDESWVVKFRQEISSSFQVSDDLSIEFDRTQCIKSCHIFIQNNTPKQHRLVSVHINLATVKLRDEFMPMKIEPRSEKILILDADYTPNKLFAVAKICLGFENGRTVRRSIRITYRQKGPVIPRSDYDIPIELENLMSQSHQMSREQLICILDCLISTVHDNYAQHFHGLLYLEEIGLLQEFKDKYSQSRGLFNDTDYRRENGKDIRTKYPNGIYDLKVNELFETRPSLKIGSETNIMNIFKLPRTKI